MTAIVATFTGSMDRLTLLTEDPQLLNQDWKNDVAAELVIWKQSYAAAAAITPPPALVDVHALTLEALRLYSEAADDIAVGLDTLDPDRLNEGIDKMTRGQGLIEEATAAIEEFGRERGLSGGEIASSGTTIAWRA